MFRISKILAGAILLTTQLTACGQNNKYTESKTFKDMNETTTQTNNDKLEIATFAAGCFWCVEAQYQQLEGVEKVVSGYIGGHVENPTYKQVCTGNTGHAEACNIYYDPSKITYDELLAAFWVAHDPTTLNRQGNDVGTQYRSAIFYHDEEQKAEAEKIIAEITEEQIWPNPVVTEVTPLNNYFAAEDYHQSYFKNNPQNQYCAMVVAPKLAKFKKTFAQRLR